jgi:hypothetical protein
LSWQHKVDHRLRALWQRVPEPERAHHPIRVLLRFTGDAEVLRQRGVRLGNVAGDIATAALSLEELEELASAREILFIEAGDL